MKFKLIVITGTPCVGKSTLAKKLSKKLGWKRLNLHYYYKRISKSYGKKNKCYNIDLKKFEKLIKEKIKEGGKSLIIDSHIAHLLPKKMVDLCLVLTCPLKTLEKRLKKRRYNKKKIRENLDAEIFQVCLNEAKEKGHKVKVGSVKELLNILSSAPL